MNTFRAMYNDTCAADCGERIHPGDEVMYRGEGADRELVHVECATEDGRPSPFDIGPKEVVCGVCWLIRPCRCDA